MRLRAARIEIHPTYRRLLRRMRVVIGGFFSPSFPHETGLHSAALTVTSPAAVYFRWIVPPELSSSCYCVRASRGLHI